MMTVLWLRLFVHIHSHVHLLRHSLNIYCLNYVQCRHGGKMKKSLAVTVALACVTGPEVESHCRGCCGIGKPAQSRKDQLSLEETSIFIWSATGSQYLAGQYHEPGAPEAQHTHSIFWFASEMSSISSWFQQRPPGTVLEGRVPLKGGFSLVGVEEQQELDFSGHSWLLVLPCFLLPDLPWCKQPPQDSCSHDLSCSTMPSLPQWAENKSQNNLSSLMLFLLDSNTMLTGMPQQSKRDRLIPLLFSVCVYMFVYTDVCVCTEDKLKLLFLRCQSPFFKLYFIYLLTYIEEWGRGTNECHDLYVAVKGPTWVLGRKFRLWSPGWW